MKTAYYINRDGTFVCVYVGLSYVDLNDALLACGSHCGTATMAAVGNYVVVSINSIRTLQEN